MPRATKDRVPLAAHWADIKKSNDTLNKSPLFKPDINGPIKTYDAGLASYLKLMQDLDKLKDSLTAFIKFSTDATSKIHQQNDELEKILDKDNAQVLASNNKLSALAGNEDADPADIVSALTDLCTGGDDLVSSRKQIWDQITKLGESKLTAAKKLRDDYKAKSTAIANSMKKIDDDSMKLETQIRAIIAAYQKIAVQMDHDDAVDAVRELLQYF